MATTEKKQNIYQKLLKIQQHVVSLGKDSKGFNYQFVSGYKVLSEIKPLMNSLGLLLKQEVISIKNTRQDYLTRTGQASEILSQVMMKFTWIDAETGEKDENLFGANGQNAFDKGVGSALTYAERYFLLKYFHIATDEDDIDNPLSNKTVGVPVEQPKPKQDAPAALPKPTDKQFAAMIQSITSGEKAKVVAALPKYSFTPEQQKQLNELLK